MHYWSIYRKANNTCSEQPKSKTHLITVEVKKSIVAARRSWQTALLLDACYQLLVILDSVLENSKCVRWWLNQHLMSSPETFGTLSLASTDWPQPYALIYCCMTVKLYSKFVHLFSALRHKCATEMRASLLDYEDFQFLWKNYLLSWTMKDCWYNNPCCFFFESCRG